MELGGDLPIDYEHQADRSRDNGQPAPAAGWIKRVYAEAGAVAADVEWNERARRFIAEREYRFISPVFAFDKATRDVKRIHGAALTNDPALAALADRALASAGMEDDMELDELRRILELPANATVETVCASVRSLQGELSTAREEKATAAVDRACREGQLPPALREWGVAYAKRDPAGFRDYLGAASPMGVDLTRRIMPNGPPGARAGRRAFAIPARAESGPGRRGPCRAGKGAGGGGRRGLHDCPAPRDRNRRRCEGLT